MSDKYSTTNMGVKRELVMVTNPREPTNPYMTPLDCAKELNQKDKLLYRISAMCGNPDAAEGCRKIIEVINEELGK